jgi:hypothetical protein
MSAVFSLPRYMQTLPSRKRYEWWMFIVAEAERGRPVGRDEAGGNRRVERFEGDLGAGVHCRRQDGVVEIAIEHRRKLQRPAVRATSSSSSRARPTMPFRSRAITTRPGSRQRR